MIVNSCVLVLISDTRLDNITSPILGVGLKLDETWMLTEDQFPTLKKSSNIMTSGKYLGDVDVMSAIMAGESRCLFLSRYCSRS